MLETVDTLATETLAAMRYMGARFILEGPPADRMWVWDAKPPADRDHIRAYWRDANRPGLRDAITKLLIGEEHEQGGAL